LLTGTPVSAAMRGQHCVVSGHHSRTHLRTGAMVSLTAARSPAGASSDTEMRPLERHSPIPPLLQNSTPKAKDLTAPAGPRGERRACTARRPGPARVSAGRSARRIGDSRRTPRLRGARVPRRSRARAFAPALRLVQHRLLLDRGHAREPSHALLIECDRLARLPGARRERAQLVALRQQPAPYALRIPCRTHLASLPCASRERHPDPLALPAICSEPALRAGNDHPTPVAAVALAAGCSMPSGTSRLDCRVGV
jgi:hypothetical protein